MKLRHLLLPCWLFFSAFSAQAANTTAYTELKLVGRTQITLTDPQLSSAEWSWLRKKRTLRLGASAPNYPPFDITPGLNDYAGLSADFLTLITTNLNINVAVFYFTDPQAMLKALEQGEIDVISHISDAEKYNEKLTLSQPYVVSAPVLIRREQQDQPLSGQPKIAIDNIFAHDPQIIRLFPAAQTVHDVSPRRALEELSFRQLDGYIGNRTTIQYLINQANLSNLRTDPLPDNPEVGFSFAAASDNPMLITIIDKILSQIPAAVKIDILRRWSGGIPLDLSDEKLQLTALEKKWITTHSRINVAVAQDFAPMSFFDDDRRYRGFTADLLNAISARTGLTFNVRNVGTLREVLAGNQRGEADVAAGLTLDAIQNGGLLATRTYFFNSWVLVGKSPFSILPKKIVLQTGHPLESFLRKQFPGVEIIATETPREGLDRVASGRADGMVLPLIAADFFLTHHYAGSLQIISSLDTEPARFALGVAPDDYPLVTILDKAMLNIQPEDLHALANNWYASISLPDDGRPAHTYTSIMLRNDMLTGSGIGLALIAVLIFIFRHRRQQRLIAELIAAREQADSASRAKTIFLATVSHEIRTPMSAIIGSLELVLRRRKADAGDWLALQRSFDSAHSLLELIGDILDIARIESDRLVLHPQRANIRQLTESTAAMFEGLAREKQLEYKLEIDAGIQGEVLIDPLRFKQILSNLLSNAVKFTQQGAVVLRAMDISEQADYLNLRIEVQDSGCGISDEARHRLFQPFSQASSSQNGSGLGLFICQSLVSMMGGKMELISSAGNGTTVSLQFSVLRLAALPASASPAPSPAIAATRRLNILIAEDHPAARHLLEQQLTFLGHHTVSVSNGKQALALTEQQQVDLVITDCNMPEINGYRFTRLLRQREQASNSERVAVWGLTAAAQPSVRENCLQAGMDDCLFKPVNLNLLAEKLQPLTAKPGVKAPPPGFSVEGLPAELADPETRQAFLTLLAESLDEERALLDDWLRFPATDQQQLRDIAHRIRGGIRFIAAETLMRRCQKIEESTNVVSTREVRALQLDLQRLSAAIKAQLTPFA